MFTLSKHNLLKMIKMDIKQEVKKDVNEFEDQLKNDIEMKTKVIEDYENSLKRLQADFENYVKRSQKEKEDFARVAIAKVLVKFVDIVDDLDRALSVLEKIQDGEVKTGIKMVHSRFHKILREEGIKPFDSEGNSVDPYKHEVIEMVSSNKSEGTVIEEIQKGYSLGDKILRVAKVRVSNGEIRK
ncbi:MAG: nucleotide exchange factor GrpE [Nanoarchaeota archaeon]